MLEARSRRGSAANDERGATLVMVALFAVALLVVTALVVDVAYAKQERRQTQNSADAAALAAAQELDGRSGQIDRAVSTAMAWAARNRPDLTTADWAGCTDPGRLAYVPPGAASAGCVSFDSGTTPTKVRVQVPVAAPSFFGSVLGWDAYDVTSDATAARTQITTTTTGGGGPCGLCSIGSNGYGLQLNLNRLEVAGGGIYANDLTANSQNSATISPWPLRWYSQWQNSNWGRNSTGFASCSPSATSCTNRYQQTSSPVPNPFASVTVTYPTNPAIQVNASGNPRFQNGSWNTNENPLNQLQPNVMYRQNVDINGGTVTLAPGTYYFANSLNVSNGATLQGTGVTLVFGCTNTDSVRKCNGSEGGKFNFNGGTTVNLTAPTSGPYANIAILFDETMQSGTASQLSGNADIQGAVYMKGAGVNMGNSGATVRAWTMVVGGKVDLNQGTLLIDNTKFGSTTTTTEPAPLGTTGAVSLVG